MFFHRSRKVLPLQIHSNTASKTSKSTENALAGNLVAKAYRSAIDSSTSYKGSGCSLKSTGNVVYFGCF